MQNPSQRTPPGPRFRHSIRNRLLALAMGATLIAILATTLVGYDLARNVISRAQQTSSESLRSQAEAYLVQINTTIAGQNNLILDRAARDVQSAADSAASIYAGDLPNDYYLAKEHLDRGPEGQWLNRKEDVTSLFVPRTQPINEDVVKDVELGAYLDLVMPAIQKNNPNAAAIYFGTTNDVTRYYPNIMLGEVVPADFQVTQRPWYVASLEQNAGKLTPSPVWTDVYQDATGLGLVTTIAIPTYDAQGKLIGVMGLDLTLDEVSRNIEAGRFLKTGYTFLVDANGKALVLPAQGYRDILSREAQADEFAPDLNASQNAAFASIIARMRGGESGFESLESGGRELFVAFSALESTGWGLGSVVAAQDVLQSVAALENDLRKTSRNILLTRVIPIGALLSISLLLATLLLTNRLVDPIGKLAQAAEQIGVGNREVAIPVQGSDEIGSLARTLSQMATQIRLSFEQLEQRVAERTSQLEKRTLQLKTAAEIANDITTARDLEALLSRAVNLVSERFGYYNVGLFLVDESGEYAHLRSASGDLGMKLMSEKIKLRVGEQGIVGYVTQFGQTRLSRDVQMDEIYQAEPLLSDTRSEMAIPLLSAGKRSETPAAEAEPRAIIGALDVQSTLLDAFSEDEVTALQVLADQLAVAIQNIRLVEQLQTALNALSFISQQQTREAWRMFSPGGQSLAYSYDHLEIKPASLERTEAETAGQRVAGARASLPIRLRDQVIGVIGLENDDPQHQWTEDEMAVLQATAEQAALSVENARLLAESQRKAAREELTGEINAQIRASLDLETVVHTAMREIAQRLGISQVEVQLGAPASDGSAGRRPNRAAGELPQTPAPARGKPAAGKKTLGGNGQHE